MASLNCSLRSIAAFLAVLGTGVVVGYAYAQSHRQPPTEHKGVGVVKLGALSEKSLQTQIGLSGYVMQLREITLAPGGQIAKHSHANRPGLVWTLSGSWTEGRAGGEKKYPASLKTALLEDENTEHWFWNDGTEPVRVVVCDVVPAQ